MYISWLNEEISNMISAISTSGFHLMFTRKLNTWYSIKDGNWSDPNTWMSNAMDKKLTLYPQPGDNVYVHHNVTLDITGVTVTGLYGNGNLIFGTGLARAFTVNSILSMTGGIDMSGGGLGHSLVLNTTVNSVNTLLTGNGAILYSGLQSQQILPFAHANFSISGFGAKILSANTTLGNITVVNPNTSPCYLECAAYNLIVQGTTNINAAYAGNPIVRISKTGAGSLLFMGQVTFGTSTVSFPGNPTIEFQGGVKFCSQGQSALYNSFNFGTGTLKFTTNNQTLDGCAWTLANNVLISGAITLSTTNANTLKITAGLSFTGDNASSTFTNNNNLFLYDFTLPMSTGIFNGITTGSAIAFYQAGDYILPYTLFQNLTIGGTGKKTLGGNTTVAGNFTVAGDQAMGIEQSIECFTYNLTVNGATSINGNNGIRIRKSGAGTITLSGYVTLGNGTFCTPGNPTIIFQGGCRYLSNGLSLDATASYGTNGITLSGNSQALDFLVGFDAPLLISGAITVTVPTTNTSSATLKGTLNGDNANSIFVSNVNLIYQNAAAPMPTGKLYCNQAANTFTYGLAGGQDITTPSDPVSPGYYNLTLNGSGAKRLLGNVSVKQVYILTGPATLNSNGFALTNP
ncbi:MAG: hypothetical protein JWQ57_2245 [Mucilaginibacter sp.]|nr:hypothetical protein [Mucilaginibacter sp.]